MAEFDGASSLDGFRDVVAGMGAMTELLETLYLARSSRKDFLISCQQRVVVSHVIGTKASPAWTGEKLDGVVWRDRCRYAHKTAVEVGPLHRAGMQGRSNGAPRSGRLHLPAAPTGALSLLSTAQQSRGARMAEESKPFAAV